MTLFRNKINKDETGKRLIHACCTGEVFELDKIPNDAISSKILGEGFGVSCSEPDIVSPADGVIEDISDNGHTYAILQPDGVFLLVCITSDSEDEVIEPAAEVGQQICTGELLCRKENAEAAVIVTNTDIMKSYKIAFGKAKTASDGVIIYKI